MAEKKAKKPTKTQRQVLVSVLNGGVMRKRYENNYPGGVTYTWHRYRSTSRLRHQRSRGVRVFDGSTSPTT